MPIEFRYDPGKGLLYGLMTGSPSVEVFTEALQAVTSSREFPPDVNTLWDLRDLDFTQVDRTLEDQLIAARRRFPERAEAKLAFVVADDLGLGMTRMYEILADLLPQQSRVFLSFEEAEEWLLGDIGDQTQS